GRGAGLGARTLAGAGPLGAAAPVMAIPLPSRYPAVLTITLTALVGVGVGYLLVTVGMTTGVLVGLAAGLLTASVHHLFGQFPASGRIWPAISAAMLAVAVSGLPVYVVGRVLLVT